MGDAELGEAPGQDARSVVNVILVSPAAVDVDAAQGSQRLRVALDHMDRVVGEPRFPAWLDTLTGLEVERQAKSVRCLWIGVVARGHAKHHDGMAIRGSQLLLFPQGLQ